MAIRGSNKTMITWVLCLYCRKLKPDFKCVKYACSLGMIFDADSPKVCQIWKMRKKVGKATEKSKILTFRE